MEFNASKPPCRFKDLFRVKDMKLAQKEDPMLEILVRCVEGDTVEFVHLPPYEKATVKAKKYSLNVDGILVYEKSRIVVHSTLRKDVVNYFHRLAMSGHQGTDRTYRVMSERFYWIRMREDIRAICVSCEECQRVKISSNSKVGKLEIFGLPTKPFQKIGVDFMGPLEATSRGYKYILTTSCLFSGFQVAEPLENVSTSSIVSTLDALKNKFRIGGLNFYRI